MNAQIPNRNAEIARPNCSLLQPSYRPRNAFTSARICRSM